MTTQATDQGARAPQPRRVVVCALGGERHPWWLPASEPAANALLAGGQRSLYELAVAIAATGREVELRGAIDLAALDALAQAADARPRIGLPARPPAPDELVIAPEGWRDPLAYARLALSPARLVLLALGPPGLFGWPFAGGWTPPPPTGVPTAALARPEHFRAITALGFELWTNSHGLADAAARAGVGCRWIGCGQPLRLPEPGARDVDVLALGESRWAQLATEALEALPAEISRCILPRRPWPEVLAALGAARVLLWPSRVEGQARISIEARAMGAVPVALRNPFAEGLDDAGGAVVVERLEQLPAATVALLAHPDELAERSRRAIGSARAQLDWTSYVQRVADALHAPAPPDPAAAARAAMGEAIAPLVAETRDARLRVKAELAEAAARLAAVGAQRDARTAERDAARSERDHAQARYDALRERRAVRVALALAQRLRRSRRR